MTTWNSGAAYASRVATIRNASAKYHLITDGALQTVIFDMSVDQLMGGAGSDLFFADTTFDEAGAVEDNISNAVAGETILDIDLA